MPLTIHDFKQCQIGLRLSYAAHMLTEVYANCIGPLAVCWHDDAFRIYHIKTGRSLGISSGSGSHAELAALELANSKLCWNFSDRIPENEIGEFLAVRREVCNKYGISF